MKPSLLWFGTLTLSLSFASMVHAESVDGDDAPPPSAEEGERPGWLVLGLSAGYGLPMGKTAEKLTATMEGQEFSEFVSGSIPLQLSVGVMVTPNIEVGLAGGYGLVFVEDCPDGADCSASQFKLGIFGRYHLDHGGKFDPWAGLSLGMESLSTSMETDSSTQDTTLSGLEFANLQAGVSLRATKALAIGPFVSFSFGQYGSFVTEGDLTGDMDEDVEETALHQWLVFGLNGSFTL